MPTTPALAARPRTATTTVRACRTPISATAIRTGSGTLATIDRGEGPILRDRHRVAVEKGGQNASDQPGSKQGIAAHMPHGVRQRLHVGTLEPLDEPAGESCDDDAPDQVDERAAEVEAGITLDLLLAREGLRGEDQRKPRLLSKQNQRHRQDVFTFSDEDACVEARSVRIRRASRGP